MFRKILAAVASLILVTGCADASVHVGGRGPGHLVKSTNGSFVGTPGVALGVSYDTSIGLSVDSNGRADLTPRAGAQVFYVNSTTGSDSNTCTQAKSAATPKASIKSAVSCVVDGEGDHVLVAQGMSYPLGLAYIGLKGGFSPAYPFVIQSYDPADPTNQAKWGTATGSNRPDINTVGTDNSQGFIQGGPSDVSRQYRALRGLNFDNTTNGAGVGFNDFSSPGGGAPSYLLIENDQWGATQFSVSAGSETNVPITNVIIRNSSFYGQWSTDGRGQGVFLDHVDGASIEDSAFVHAGWKIGAAKTDPVSSGGFSGQAHPIYSQVGTVNVIVRRNAFVDNSGEAGELKSGGIYYGNLAIGGNIGGWFGYGNLYSEHAPLGVYGDGGYNAFIGAAWCYQTSNIKQGSGSSVHQNVCARSDPTLAGAHYAFMADDPPDLSAPGPSNNVSLPTYPIFDRNVAYLWGTSGQDQAIQQNSGLGQANPGLLSDIHYTYTNNLWGDPTSGTNTNNASTTFANAYTEAALLSALGYADRATAEAAWEADPQLHGWRTGAPLMLAGYGVADPGLVDIGTNMALTAGYVTSGQFMSARDGSTYTVSGLPSGVTFAASCKCWHYDGSNTTVSSGTFTIREDMGALTHTTTIPWSISARPVLSSLVATAGNGQATVNVSSNTASGKLFVEATSGSAAPDWAHIRGGLDSIDAAAMPHTSQAVTATGAQPAITLTGLTNGTPYYVQVAQLDGNSNPSLTLTSAQFTPSAASTPATILGANLVAWYEVDDLTTLYQDTGCSTTPVTTDLQTVKCIKDKSGNGFNASNSTGWVYHANSGKPYLAMDGTSTFGTASLTYADANGVWAGWFVGQTAGNSDLIDVGLNRSLWTVPGTNLVGYARDSSGTQLAQDGISSAPVANTNYVLSFVMTGTTGSGTVEAFKDNVGNGSTAWTGTPGTTGGLNFNHPTSATGRLYVVVIAKGDQSANRTNMQTYLAALHD